MPQLIKDGTIIDNNWISVDADNEQPLQKGQICTLQQWLTLPDKAGSAVQLEPGESPSSLFDALDDIDLIAINFPVFTDGRGFSYGRELRERGYTGELRACGHFIRDQLGYLQRVGFNAFQLADDTALEEALGSLKVFSECYQASIDQPLPLFRRRA